MNSSLARRLAALKKLLPGEILLEPRVLKQYAGDKWFATHQPDAVALPRSTKSVAAILRFANRHGIPVTARGAGHGYVGGCVPSHNPASSRQLFRTQSRKKASFTHLIRPVEGRVSSAATLSLTQVARAV